MTERIGFWIDLDDAYYTLTNDYIESVWWLLRQICGQGAALRGLQGRALLPALRHGDLQPRDGAGLSRRHRAVGLRALPAHRRRGRDARDPGSAGRRRATAPASRPLPVAAETAPLSPPGRRPVSLAVWTTTPWTLVSNVACAVNPEIDYALVESRGERFVLARDLVEAVLGAKAVVERVIPGRELLGPRVRAALPVRGARPARLVCGRRRLRHDHRRHRHRAHRAGLRRRRHAHRARQRPAGRQSGRRRRALRRRGRALGPRRSSKTPTPASSPTSRRAACCWPRCPTSTATRSAGAATRRCSTTPRRPGT